MDVGNKIKIALLEKRQSQKWLAETTGISYDRLNASLNNNRSLNIDEFSVILWALNRQASDFIDPISPEFSYTQ